MGELAEEYIDAVRKNNHREADKVYKEIQEHNVGANKKVKVSKRKVMAAYNTIKGDKSFLRRRLIDPGAHATILTRSGGKTRRRPRRSGKTDL
jgi:hypothetical protein